jgi:hypothetical protein
MFDTINSSSNFETVYHLGILEPNDLTSMHDTIGDLNKIECENPADLSNKQLCVHEDIIKTSTTAIAHLYNILHNHVYLGNGETLPIIVSNDIIKSQVINKVNDEQEIPKAEFSQESNAGINTPDLQENVDNIKDSAQKQNKCRELKTAASTQVSRANTNL